MFMSNKLRNTPEEMQEGIAKSSQKRPYDAVPDTLKEHLLPLVQTDPNESIHFFSERVSIPRHNLRKLIRNVKQPGFKLEKKNKREEATPHTRGL